MIETARRRMQAEDPGAAIQFELLPTEHLAQLRPRSLFDGVLSNFSGLNCVADLDQAARTLGSLVFPGAPVLVCLSTRFCLVEMLWFLFHGEPRKAFRRTSGKTTAKVGKFQVKVHYPTLGEVERLFSPSFRLRSCTGIGVAVPPSYLESTMRKHPRVFDLLCLLDRRIARLPLLRTMGDHMLLYFERVEDRCC